MMEWNSSRLRLRQDQRNSTPGNVVSVARKAVGGGPANMGLPLRHDLLMYLPTVLESIMTTNR